jgi:hypothetical protein
MQVKNLQDSQVCERRIAATRKDISGQMWRQFSMTVVIQSAMALPVSQRA